ncbi:hypothetical protein [Thalassotalea agarivorans]|uniref:hypothetical protein n=1 Tax=Thalassotalea agarivorans TaxID=349064 RepID=UPI00115FB352|nr:hypothetical protein [Thalassotalea agarivorans]
MKILKTCLALSALLLASCTTQYSSPVSDGASSDQCSEVARFCREKNVGIYDEWYRENGEKSCVCHQNVDNPEPVRK